MHHALPPGAVDRVEAKRVEQLKRAADRARALGDEIRIAVHEADPAPVGHDREDVAGEQGAPAVLAASPVQYLPAVEVHAGIDECQTSTDRVRVALPEDDSLVRPGDPLPVGRVDVDRRVECMRPLDHAAVEMRVADCDCIDAAERVHGRDRLVVDVGDHVPDDVPGWRSDQQGALTDRRRRAGADAGDPGAFLLEPAPVAGAGEFSQAGPLLPVPPDVLALVQADRAVVTRRSVLNTAGYADGEVSSHPSRYTPAAVHGIDPEHMTGP